MSDRRSLVLAQTDNGSFRGHMNYCTELYPGTAEFETVFSNTVDLELLRLAFQLAGGNEYRMERFKQELENLRKSLKKAIISKGDPTKTIDERWAQFRDEVVAFEPN